MNEPGWDEVDDLRQEVKRLKADLADARAALDLALRARDNWRKANDEKLAEIERLREVICSYEQTFQISPSAFKRGEDEEVYTAYDYESSTHGVG
jgi:hypothetical protein